MVLLYQQLVTSHYCLPLKLDEVLVAASHDLLFLAQKPEELNFVLKISEGAEF